jgi:hypothetical protein
MVLAKVGERGIGGGTLRHAGMLQHEIEVQPAARAIVGSADHGGGVDVVGGLLFSGRERSRRDAAAMPRQRSGDARPRRVAEHTAGVEKHRLNGHAGQRPP